MNKNDASVCGICGKEKEPDALTPVDAVRPAIADAIGKTNPDWKATGHVCGPDLNHFVAEHTKELLEREKGELSTVEAEVIESLEERGFLSKNTETEFERRVTLGERLADQIARFGGSWGFIISFALFLLLWITANSILLLRQPFDPYPFILLNLALSTIAAIQAPVIMMSQNRQEAKNRLEAEHDYRVNLKAELEVQHISEKIDHMLAFQVKRFQEIAGTGPSRESD